MRLQRRVMASTTMYLPEEIVIEILSRLPLVKVFQAQTVCHLWRDIVGSSQTSILRKLWEERNSEPWLVMDTADGGVAMFNRSGWFTKKIFDSSCWHLMAAAGGLLLYRNRNDGMLHVVNPLTMESRQLPDPLLVFVPRQLSDPPLVYEPRPLSAFFIYDEICDRAVINLAVDSITRTYQVILLGCLTERRNLLIYESSEQSWKIKTGDTRSSYEIYGSWVSCKTECNQSFYYLCFSRGKSVDQWEGSHVKGNVEVLCNGTNIRVATWTPPIGRRVILIYELDEVSCQWDIISVCRFNPSFVSDTNRVQFDELLCEEDLEGIYGSGRSSSIWMMPVHSDNDAQMIKLRMHKQDNFNGHNHENSKAFPMPLRFWPCP